MDDDKHSRNDKYEQEFIEKVRKTTPSTSPRVSAKTPKTKSTTPIIIAIVLAIIVLVESIVLAVYLVNNSSLSDDEEFEIEAVDDSPEALSNGGNLTFDDRYMVIAFNYICSSDDGAKYIFDKSKHFQKLDASSNLVSSGTYSIINGGAVVLNDSDAAKEDTVVYFGGYYIMEGLTFYNCREE